MGKTWNSQADVSRTSHGYSIRPENLVVIDALNGRVEANSVDELIKDIEENGQLVPVVCWKNNDGWPVLAAGHRRYRAIMEINRKRKSSEEKMRLHFLAIDASNEAEAFDFTVRENFQRRENTPLDNAHNMHIYQTRFGLGEEDIAKKYYPGTTSPEELEKAVKEVKKTLKLLELSPEAQEELKKGFISTSAAQQLAAIPSRTKQNEVIAEAKAKNKKSLSVADATAAKEQVIGEPVRRPTRTSISENSPVKRLKKFTVLAETAGGLAAEILADERDETVLMELSREIVVMCKKLGVPLFAKVDKWADANQDYKTSLDLVEV